MSNDASDLFVRRVRVERRRGAFTGTQVVMPLVLLCVLLACGSASLAGPEGDWTVGRVLEAIKEREGRLAQLQVRVAAGGKYVEPDGGVSNQWSASSPETRRVSLWRDGPHVAHFMSWITDPVFVGHESRWAWDGKRHRLYSPGHHNNQPVAALDDERVRMSGSSPSGSRYFELLGLYAYEPWIQVEGQWMEQTLRLSEWLEQRLASDNLLQRPTVSEVTEDGATFVELSFQDSCPLARRHRFRFDVRRDFMPVLHERLLHSGATAAGEPLPHQLETHEVEEAREVDGLWVPVRTRKSVVKNWAMPGLVADEYYVVEHISLEKPDPKHFIVEFPVGTEVFDEVRQVAYRIVDDGVVRPLWYVPRGAQEPVGSPDALVRQSVSEDPPRPNFNLVKVLDHEPADAADSWRSMRAGRPSSFLVFTSVLLMAPAASPASAIASHSDSAGLALDDQKTRLVERLRERYEKLSPLTVEVGRAVRALDPVTGRPRTAASPTSDRAFRLRLLRMGDRMAVRIFWDVPDGTYISHNAKWAWVDDRFRMFSPKDDIGTPVGQIRGQPLEVRTLDSPGQHAYFQLAGLFANEVDTTRSMASGTGATSPWWKWFSQAADELGLKVADVDAAEDAVPGEVAHSGRLIRCELGRRGSHPSIDTIWLDPSKGYMPVRSRKEWFAGRPGSFEAKPYHTKTHRVIEAKEVAPGIWMPTRTTHTTEAPRNPDPLVQEEFVVRDLSMEPLPADAFSVEFPPGTEVIDWINQVCYRVLPDGRVAPRPFIPAPNAPMVESPPALVEESVKQNPPYDGFVFRGIADESEMASAVTPRASVTMWLLPSLAGLVGIGGVLIYRKLRPMS